MLIDHKGSKISHIHLATLPSDTVFQSVWPSSNLEHLATRGARAATAPTSG